MSDGPTRDIYFEDFEVGQVITTAGLTITESQIVDFALLYDPQPFHVDAEAAAESPFGGLIASGFQTLALTFRLLFQEGVLAKCGLGSPGMDELRWLAPLRPGDRLSAEAEVLELRASKSKPDRGTLLLGFRTLNQHGTVIMTFRTIVLVRRRPVA